MIPVREINRILGPDGVSTSTSDVQKSVEDELQNVYAAVPKPLVLQRMSHFNWLKTLLFQGLPASYKSQDASQTWMIFWIIQSFQLLGAGFDPQTKQRAINTIIKCQHPNGGFGGGPGQEPGLLPTYSAISALVCVGRPGPGGGWDDIDREKMYAFFMSLKQPDGSFIVSKNAEVDVRAVYSVIVTATLLDMLTPELVANTASFIASTQTYEGGFAAASAPYFISNDTFLDEPRPALGEAHGGYAGCAIASWVMLEPFLKGEDAPKLNIAKFLRWLVWMQGGAREIGGFRGRSNKLVDNCYSWWCGGSLAIVESILDTRKETGDELDVQEDNAGTEDDWEDTDWWMYDNRALQEYILGVGQGTTGGLRDKPGKGADVYHTFYSLCGLSTAQHRIYRSKTAADKLRSQWKDSPAFRPFTSKAEREGEITLQARRREIWVQSRSWREDETSHRYVGSPNNRVNATHPIFTLLISQCDAILNHFYGQTATVDQKV